MSDTLDALERRGDELEAFADCTKQANEYMAEHGTDELVVQLRQARTDRRRIRCGTINTLILLAHIDRLEEALANMPVNLRGCVTRQTQTHVGSATWGTTPNSRRAG